MATSAQIRSQIETALADRIPRALTFKTHQEQEVIPCGFNEVDRLRAFPRGALVELCGPASSGRTTLLHGILANVTARGEAAAFLDPTDSFDPVSAKQNGAVLKNLLWIRSGPPRTHKRVQLGPLDQMLMGADLILQSGGFGLVVLDFVGISPKMARAIPLTTWFGMRRAVENTRTLLLALTEDPNAGSSASVTVRLEHTGLELASTEDRASNLKHIDGDCLVRSIGTRVEVLRARQRKPSQSVHQAANFATTLQGYG
jgi:hypothetical protein